MTRHQSAWLLLFAVTACTGTPITVPVPELQPEGASAKKTPEDYTDSTKLGWAIERQFLTLRNLCFGANPFTASTVPSEIRETENGELSQKGFRLIEDANLASLFNYVFEKGDLMEWDPGASGSRFLKAVKGTPTPNPDFNNIVYVNSCMSMVKAGLAARAGADLSVAALKAAVDVEFDANTRKDLTLVRGRFDSPFALDLQSDDAARKLAAHLAVWTLYSNSPDLVKKSPQYLSNVTGWFVTWLINVSRDLRSQVNAQAGANWVVASAAAHSSYSGESRSKMNLTGYRILALRESADSAAKFRASFEALPTPAKIEAELSDAASYTEPTEHRGSAVAVRGSSQRHHQVIHGMPRDMCRWARWRTNGVVAPRSHGRVELKAVQASRDTGLVECHFDVEFMPTWDDSATKEAAARGSLSFAYTLDYTMPVGLDTLSIQAKATVRTTDFPQVDVQANPDHPAFRAAFVSRDQERFLTFALPFRVLTSEIVRPNFSLFGSQGKLTLRQGRLTCGSFQDDVEVWVDRMPDGGYSLNGEYRLLEKKPPIGVCSIKADISIPRLGGGSPYVRPFVSLLRIDRTEDQPTPPAATSGTNGEPRP